MTELTNDFDKFQLLSFDQISLASMRTTVSRIILIVLFVFSLFLFLILTIVTRYTIIASIEDDYSSIGIMKALGFKNKNITFTLLMQYILIIAVAMILGVLGAMGVTPILGGLLLRTSGVLWKGNLSPIVLIIISILILLFALVIVYLQTRKAARISPIEAINLGKKASNSNRKGILLYKRPFSSIPISIRMSIKQVSTTARQYISLFILSIIFSFMILTVIGLSGAFSSSEKVASLLGYDLNDLSLKIVNTQQANGETVEKIADEIDEKYGVNYFSVYDTNTKAYADDNRTQLLIFSEFQESNLLDGAVPEAKNEIIISQGVSDELSKNVGDTIDISLSGDSEKIKYKVSGINNQIYRMGKSISMTEEGFKQINKSFLPTDYLLKVDDNNSLDKKIDEITDDILSDNPGVSIANERELTMKRIEAIQVALSSISYAVIVISLLLISVITLLVSIVVIKRETLELGILKSLGFTSRQIRTQFSLRFVFVALIGSLVGMCLNLISDNILIDSLFGVVNIVSIPNGLSVGSLIFTVCFIVLTTLLFAWLVSFRIKKVDVKVLIAE